jgi:hypothetical protein
LLLDWFCGLGGVMAPTHSQAAYILETVALWRKVGQRYIYTYIHVYK